MGESQARDFALGALASRSLRVFGAPNEENKGRQGGCYPSEYRRQGGCQQHPSRPMPSKCPHLRICTARCALPSGRPSGAGEVAGLTLAARRGEAWCWPPRRRCGRFCTPSAARWRSVRPPRRARASALTQPHTPSNDQHAPSPTAVARGRCEAAALTPRRGVNSPRSGLSPSRPLQRGWRAPRRPPLGARWARGRCWWSPTRTTRPCSSRRC